MLHFVRICLLLVLLSFVSAHTVLAQQVAPKERYLKLVSEKLAAADAAPVKGQEDKFEPATLQLGDTVCRLAREMSREQLISSMTRLVAIGDYSKIIVTMNTYINAVVEATEKSGYCATVPADIKKRPIFEKEIRYSNALIKLLQKNKLFPVEDALLSKEMQELVLLSGPIVCTLKAELLRDEEGELSALMARIELSRPNPMAEPFQTFFRSKVFFRSAWQAGRIHLCP